ncbi:translation initiation factor IF3-1, mitochondrial-like [Argentina anserina]|uniref:translation initiation factor IF3-1, mitochondrial-like n=1 Tax=Argentina anserina TaxID=57926 RepID=UPI0021763BE0|nr:translation initiation factor IF3-1, mitochondrial-like [Potentilla anserina]
MGSVFYRRLTQSKLRQFARHIKILPYASSSSLLNPTVSKPCISDNPLFYLPGFGSQVRFFAAPVQANGNAKKAEQGSGGPRLNEHIQADVIRLVVGEEHFVMSKSEALQRARKLELDLVEVQHSSSPPVCKIMDYHKERYKQVLREKERIKIKSKEVKTLRSDTKEVKFSPKTEAKDLKMKADRVIKFMDKGYRVKCTATDSEGRNLDAVFSGLIALIDDAAYIECDPTVGRGKESYIMVRHVKFGPPKSGVKKKAEDKKKPEKASDDGVGVTTADTVPLPSHESSGMAENRYRNTEISPTREMDGKRGTPEKGEAQLPYQSREIPIPHFSPSMGEQQIPYQRREAPTDVHSSSPVRETNRATPSAFRNCDPLPNGVPKQEPRSSNPPRPAGPKQESLSSRIPLRSRSPGLGYGIFSNSTGNRSVKEDVRDRFPANPNSPSSRPYSS